jgi:hypothetical protein
MYDGEHIDEFYERWGNWLATAAIQQLQRPVALLEEAIDSKFFLK